MRNFSSDRFHRTRPEKWFQKPTKYCSNGKVIYDKKGAITAKNLRWKQDRVWLRIYECNGCGGWHLTHKKNWFEEDQV